MRTQVSQGQQGSGVTVRVIRRELPQVDASISRQNTDTDFGEVSGIIEPKYALKSLATLIENSSILPQVIDCMYTNIAGYGYRIIPIKEGIEIDETERDILNTYIDSPNSTQSLSTVMKAKVRDYESYAFAFIEVVRDIKGFPTILRHAKAYYTRACGELSDPIPVTYYVNRGKRKVRIVEYRRFRKFIQQGEVSGQYTYFKEFGDPRQLNYKTGTYGSPDRPVPSNELATELMFHTIIGDNVYGIPKWVSQSRNILGTKEAEEVNLGYFEENTVPPIMLSVANGKLTSQSFNTINDLFSGSKGKLQQNRVVLVEAIGESLGLDSAANVEIKVEKLADQRPNDGLFGTYMDGNTNKVMSSFRLDPILVGLGGNKTFASANVALSINESQVFQPERSLHDEWFNKNFVNNESGLGLRTCKIESCAPKITNSEQLMRILTASNVMGALTPRTSIDIVNETMQLTIPQYPKVGEEGYMDWMDKPIQIALRETATTATQQTNQGDNTHIDQSTKSPDNKKTEATGVVGPEATNNMMDKGQLPN